MDRDFQLFYTARKWTLKSRFFMFMSLKLLQINSILQSYTLSVEISFIIKIFEIEAKLRLIIMLIKRKTLVLNDVKWESFFVLLKKDSVDTTKSGAINYRLPSSGGAWSRMHLLQKSCKNAVFSGQRNLFIWYSFSLPVYKQ